MYHRNAFQLTWNMTRRYGGNRVNTENNVCMRIFRYAVIVIVSVH